MQDQDPRSRCYNESQSLEHSIVIASAAVRLNSTRPDAITGYGAFFGTNSVHNTPFSYRETDVSKRRAELQAAILTLRNVRDKITNGEYNVGSYIDQVIITTDSAYVVQSMTNWIDTWRSNGYTNNQGGDLLNQCDMRTLDRGCNELGSQVRFLQVTHAENREAYRLASEAIY
jgi:ribonuclease HI